MENKIKNETMALVIDARKRDLSVFVASVTQAQEDETKNLVLRHAVDVADNIRTLLSETESKEFLAEMPVIIMGGFSAASSAGHAGVVSSFSWGPNGEMQNGHRRVTIVGGLGKPFGGKGLKVLGWPIEATLVRGPVRISEVLTGSNSNVATAAAAFRGVELLAKLQPKSVFLTEGQSDYTSVIRLTPSKEEGFCTEFPTEHRAEMFTRQCVIRRMLWSAAWHAHARGLQATDPRPTDEDLLETVKSRAARYRSALEGKEGEIISLSIFGPAFSRGLTKVDESILDGVLEELQGDGSTFLSGIKPGKTADGTELAAEDSRPRER